MTKTSEHEMIATRCRRCERDIPPGSGLKHRGVVDPLCAACMSLPEHTRHVTPLTPKERRSITHCSEEAVAALEGRIGAARDDSQAALRRIAELHSAVSDIRTQYAALMEELAELRRKVGA